MADAPELEQEIQALSAELRKLEGEYNMYFAGRTPRPPIESRGRVDQLFKRWDRRQMDSAAMRFRLQTLQSRYSSFVDLWDRSLRAREEGRPSPLYRPREIVRSSTPVSTTHTSASPHETTTASATSATSASTDTPIDTTTPAASPGGPQAITFTDPRQEGEKLQALYDLLMDARRQVGEAVVPFHKFAALVKEQTQRLKKKGLDEVTFSVTTTGGHVNLTAKGSKLTRHLPRPTS